MKLDLSMYLTALDWPDAEKARAWRNDFRVMAFTRQSDFISDVEQRAWFDRQTADPTIRMYAIKLRHGSFEESVGVCGLTSLDWLHRRAEFSLYVAPTHQRRGYGREALKLLLQHAFENLGLHQVWGETFEGNPALKIFIQLGMQYDGKRRAFYYKDGALIDAHLVSILREEWERVTRRKPDPDPPGGDANPVGSDAAPAATPGGSAESEAPPPTPIRRGRKPKTEREAPGDSE